MAERVLSQPRLLALCNTPNGVASLVKWSRDNASVATNISRIEGDNLLTVDRVAIQLMAPSW